MIYLRLEYVFLEKLTEIQQQFFKRLFVLNKIGLHLSIYFLYLWCAPLMHGLHMLTNLPFFQHCLNYITEITAKTAQCDHFWT